MRLSDPWFGSLLSRSDIPHASRRWRKQFPSHQIDPMR